MHTHIHTVIVPSSLSTLRIATINTQYSPTVEVVVDDGLAMELEGSTGERKRHYDNANSC